MSDNSSATPSSAESNSSTVPAKQRRWPGVVFSILIPGFGLARAGLYKRAITWLLAILLMQYITLYALASEMLPIVGCLLMFAVSFVMAIWMWCDSYRPGRMTWKLWLAFAAAIAITYPLPTFSSIGKSFAIPTHAMAPTLKPGDQIIVNRLIYKYSKPKRGDIVAFATSNIESIAVRNQLENHDSEVYYVKRLVGLPGEKIEIKEGNIYANGIKLGAEDGIPPIRYTDVADYISIPKVDGAYIVGPDEYFMLGDNSEQSADSRYWGFVPASEVFGKATKILYPFSRMGDVKWTNEPVVQNTFSDR